MATHEPFIVQIIPYDGIGGVEIAAATVEPGSYDGFRFGKAFIASKQGAAAAAEGIIETGFSSENDPRAYIRLIRKLLAERADILLLSLWRSCLVGLVVKLLRPRTKLVLFLHNVVDAHPLDAAITRITSRFAVQTWADSASTARQRLPRRASAGIRAISFLAERLPAVTAATPAPHFISWGRLHPRKNLGLAINFFAEIHALYPAARFTIIGPDGGEEQKLRQKVAELKLCSSISFFGPASHEQIIDETRRNSFFLQTSNAEGMAMATVEAMQLGLVPVVTSVGEIASYVRHGENGIIFSDVPQAFVAVEDLLSNQERYNAMRAAAINAWDKQLLYRESFVKACCRLAKRAATKALS